MAASPFAALSIIAISADDRLSISITDGRLLETNLPASIVSSHHLHRRVTCPPASETQQVDDDVHRPTTTTAPRAMKLLKEKAVRTLGLAYSLSFSAFMSFVTMLFINSFIGSAIALWSISRFDRRRLVMFCSATLRTWFSIFMGHLEHFSRMTIVLTGDPFFANEAALVVCNHRSWTDTVILYSLARQVRMHGDVKFLAKRSLLAFPIFGFAGWILDVVIFIKRQSSSAGRRMGNLFSSLTDPRRERLPYWLISYLEGTRFTKKKHSMAIDFAKERGLMPLRHMLQPRTKGFLAQVRALRGNAEAVYDVTIGYQENDKKEMEPSFSTMYFTPSRVDRVIHVHQRRIPMDDVPEDDEELKQWVYKLYEQKDEMLDGFKQTGKFGGRPLRWNRMTFLYWLRCQLTIYSGFAMLLYLCIRLVTHYNQ